MRLWLLQLIGLRCGRNGLFALLSDHPFDMATWTSASLCCTCYFCGACETVNSTIRCLRFVIANKCPSLWPLSQCTFAPITCDHFERPLLARLTMLEIANCPYQLVGIMVSRNRGGNNLRCDSVLQLNDALLCRLASVGIEP